MIVVDYPLMSKGMGIAIAEITGGGAMFTAGLGYSLTGDFETGAGFILGGVYFISEGLTLAIAESLGGDTSNYPNFWWSPYIPEDSPQKQLEMNGNTECK